MAEWKDIIIILLIVVIAMMLFWYYRMRSLSGFCHCAEYGMLKTLDKPLHNFWRGAPCTMMELPPPPPGSVKNGCVADTPPPCQRYYQKPLCADLGLAVV